MTVKLDDLYPLVPSPDPPLPEIPPLHRRDAKVAKAFGEYCAHRGMDGLQQEAMLLAAREAFRLKDRALRDPDAC